MLGSFGVCFGEEARAGAGGVKDLELLCGYCCYGVGAGFDGGAGRWIDGDFLEAFFETCLHVSITVIGAVPPCAVHTILLRCLRRPEAWWWAHLKGGIEGFAGGRIAAVLSLSFGTALSQGLLEASKRPY